MARTTGFGSAPGSVGDQGVVIPSRNPRPIAEQTNEYLRRIAERYDQPPLLQPYSFSLEAGESQKIDYSQMEINTLLVSVIEGTVNLYFGDYTGAAASGAIPHAQFTALGIPTQIMLPPNGYIFTVQEETDTNTATVTITPMYI